MGLQVRRVFLDITKGFDEVWHKELICKLLKNGISGDLLSASTNFIVRREQRVVLNDRYFSWANVEAWVPQGSILGAAMFLIYINDLPYNVSCNLKLFADDTFLFSMVRIGDTSSND